MKKTLIALMVILALALTVLPASAQLGDVDNSSFTVQNTGDGEATVEVAFYEEDGTEHTPSPLNGGQPNPFTLDPGESFEVVVANIPGLPDGRYSVVISSDQEVVAIANLIGQNSAGTIFYNGSYSGVAMGADTAYVPSALHEYYDWNSLISVQNAGSSATNVTVDYTCPDGSTAQHTMTGLAPGASVHFDLETNAPSGMPTGCNGSAEVSSTGGTPLIVVDNQTADGGFTQSFNGFTMGTMEVNIPALYHQYYTWDSSLNIRKIGAGSTTVTVSYSDGGSSSCTLTDASPSCLLYMPSEHPGTGLFAADMTSSSLPVVAIVNSANPSDQAQTYGGFAGGTGMVGLPTVMKKYYGWDTSFTCQNVGTVATSLNISYQGHETSAYDTASLGVGDSVEVYQPGESFLMDGYRGGVTVTANASGAEIACIVNQTHGANQAAGMGDWSMSYNAE
jgi:hypothetical protein